MLDQDNQNYVMNDIPLQKRLNQDLMIGHDVTQDNYDCTPISEFGKKMLQQMGWYEGRGIGKTTTNSLQKPVEFIPRKQNEGLGVTVNLSKEIMTKKLKGIQLTKEEQQIFDRINQMAMNGDSKNIDNKLLYQINGFKINDKVKIILGQHKGLKGKLVKIINEQCIVELCINEMKVNLKLEQITPYLKNKNDNKLQKNSEEEQIKYRTLKWVVPHIKAKVISKKFLKGKLYNKKIIITDKLDSKHFQCITCDEYKEVIDTLREKDIQTCIPDLEKQVLVIKGDFKNEIGILKSKDKKINKVIVQLQDSYQLIELTQDDISEFVSYY